MGNEHLEHLKLKPLTFTYDSKFRNVSPSILSLLGYSHDEITSKSFSDIIDGFSDTHICEGLSGDLYANGGSLNEDVILLDAVGNKVGGKLGIEWSGGSDPVLFCYFIPSGKVVLEESKLNSEKIIETSVSAYIELDPDYHIVTADKEFRFYFNVKDDPIGMDLGSIKGLEEFSKVLKGDTESICMPFDINGDKLIALIGRSERQIDIRFYGWEFLLYSRFPWSLPAVQARKLVWDGITISFLIDPEEKVVVEANKAAANFYGYTQDELRGMTVSNLNILPADVLDQEIEMAIAGTKNIFIFRHRTSNGTIKDVMVSVVPIELFGKLFLFTFVTDITRRKNLEKVIEEKNRMLTDLNIGLSKMVQREVENRKKQEQLFMQQSRLIAMSEMVGAVAHHWRQPLNTIGLLVQDLEDANTYGELNDKYITEVVHKVMSHLHMMSQSIDNFRSLFKPSKEKILFDVKDAISDVVRLMMTQFKNHRIMICMDCNFCSTAPESCIKTEGGCVSGFLSALGYCNEFKQVMLNVLTNSYEAIRIRRSNGLLLEEDEGFIFVNLKKEGEYISIIIDDNGGGLGDSVISKAFEPYFTTKREGFGVGLYMAKTFVESGMGGIIDVENIEEGCRITIKVPYRDSPYN